MITSLDMCNAAIISGSELCRVLLHRHVSVLTSASQQQQMLIA